MELLIIVMFRPFAQMFNLAELVCSLKAFRLNLFSPRETDMLNCLALYMRLIFFNSLMILFAFFELQFLL